MNLEEQEKIKAEFEKLNKLSTVKLLLKDKNSTEEFSQEAYTPLFALREYLKNKGILGAYEFVNVRSLDELKDDGRYLYAELESWMPIVVNLTNVADKIPYIGESTAQLQDVPSYKLMENENLRPECYLVNKQQKAAMLQEFAEHFKWYIDEGIFDARAESLDTNIKLLKNAPDSDFIFKPDCAYIDDILTATSNAKATCCLIVQ
ncbi:hypothetical protein [Rheinheimera sp. WS51]|uniref:hypothetical protein n=1 Tax=Rheinheimera sp. WS51 TaxID=3425886 RepID=UPI003D95038A